MTKQYIEKEFGEKLVSHFKFLASMDIGEAEATKWFTVFTNGWTGSVFTSFHASNCISRKSRYSSSFTSIYSAVISSFIISKYSRRNYFLFTLFPWVTRIYWTDWIGEDNNNVCIIRGN